MTSIAIAMIVSAFILGNAIVTASHNIFLEVKFPREIEVKKDSQTHTRER